MAWRGGEEPTLPPYVTSRPWKGSDMTQITITAQARAILRQAITDCEGWPQYKAATGKLISQYGKEDFITACQALGLDIHNLISSAGENAMKERTHDLDAVNALRNRLATVAFNTPQSDLDKATAILDSIDTRGGGRATSAQYYAIERVVQKGEAARQTGGTATDATPVVIPRPVVLTAPAPVSAPVSAPSAAGVAMYDIIRDAARADLAPLVGDLVTRALEGTQTIRIELTQGGQTMGKTDGHQHPMFSTLCRALSARQADGFSPNVWINGPAGSGKSHGTRQFAQASGQAYHFQGASMMPHEVLGFIDASGTYHRTSFREAFEFGGVFCFDEADAWSNEALLVLNAALANGRMQFPDAMVARHVDCRIIATANTFGLGGTADYVGRAKLDAAFLSRFPVKLSWGYDAALEVAICGNADFARRVQAARERARSVGLKVLIDPRATMAGAALIAQGFTHDEAASLTYLANLSPEQVKQVEGRSI